MTPAQRRIAQAAARSTKKRAAAKLKRERKAALVQRRKERRAAKAAPKNRLVVWSRLVRLRDGGCVVCGGIDHLQAHHLLPKERYKEYKFVVFNGITLCPTHHKFGKYSAHRNPLWFSEWLRANRPMQYDWAINRLGDLE